MRADRLVSLVLLLRQRGRMTAAALAAELEVSVRTVLRDVEALSASGVPVYAERGRTGGYSLLPGFRTELTGLNHEESLALLTAGSGAGATLGLGAALGAARRKVVDALPSGHRAVVDDAVGRLLVEPETDLLARRTDRDAIAPAIVREVREAVLGGRRLRLHYAAPDKGAAWLVVDTIGLVTIRGRVYLLATRDGMDRTYRLSRVLAAEALDEPADRPPQVDLDQVWRDRGARFLADGRLDVRVRVDPVRRDELLDSVRAVRDEDVEDDGWSRMDVVFDDLRHATWALWRLGTGVEAVAPPSLRDALGRRAAELADRYAGPSVAT